MAKRIVDANKLLLHAQVTDWESVFRRRIQRERNNKEIQVERHLESSRIVQLRWLLSPALGYPTEPFRVHRRRSVPLSEKPVTFTMGTFLFERMATFELPVPSAHLVVDAPSGGLLRAFAGTPIFSPTVAQRTLTPGINRLALSGAKVLTMVLPTNATLLEARALTFDFADDPSWELIELVGLPVGADWAGVLELGQPQGRPGALIDARNAALDRFRRGAPFYGWEPNLSSGANAPPWRLADPLAMLKLIDAEVLPPLREMVSNFPPSEQWTYQIQRSLPPVDPLHPALTNQSAEATIVPLRTLLFGAATDPLASLMCGFGTAYEDTDLPRVVISDRVYLDDHNHSDWDFMVTARYARGADGVSDESEYAAMVFAPRRGEGPDAVTGLAVESPGLRAPTGVDESWRAIHRVTWAKADDAAFARAASYAFARESIAPAGVVTALMGPRPHDTALQPISATTSQQQAQAGRLAALDETYPVASAPSPNSLAYAIAQQDLFGLWSPWQGVGCAVAEPPVQAVTLVASRIETTAVAAGSPCPGTLVLELSWDWATRSPRMIELVGHMYAQAQLGQGPANTVPPPSLQTTLNGLASSVQLVFNGAATANVVTSLFNVTGVIEYLSQDGKTIAPTPVIHTGPRRYRLTLRGLSLDFDAAGRIGLALWARGVEQRAPGRQGAMNVQPLIASTADPRPPVVTLEHEDVLMASIADARGEHHARLGWTTVPGAYGYFVYESSESKLRADRGLSEPARSLTLAQRLSELRDAFARDPDRRSFTRVNATPVGESSMQVTLPRGSKEIHCYVVLGLSTGQVESAWPAPGSPNLRKRFIAYAAPQIAIPSPPDIEVTRTLDRSVDPPVFRAGLRVRTKPGATVTRVDIHRVRVPEAAIDLDTMGPPIARITESAAPFAVTPVTGERGEAQPIGMIAGLDAVEGSWKRVFYRAAAWANDDPARGLFGGRSKPSAVREVLVPPATPPTLLPLAWSWSGGTAAVQLQTRTTAPLASTPMGEHRLRVDVLAEHEDGSSDTLLVHPSGTNPDDRLAALPTAPPGSDGTGLWRTSAGDETLLRMAVLRASNGDRLRVRVLLSDPLGRATEQTLLVPANLPNPLPDVLGARIARRLAGAYLVQFQTHAPVTATPSGAYRLRVRYQPLPGSIRALDVRLPDIETLTLPDFSSDPAPLPVRRQTLAGGLTRIWFVLRGGPGRVLIGVVAPDGRSAAETLNLP